MMKPIGSPAKLELIKFLKETKGDEQYTFIVRGTVADAKRFLQRMRTELSRLRTIARSKGKPAGSFRLKTISMDEGLIENSIVATRVTILKHVKLEHALHKELQDVLSEVEL